ncbi:GTPase SAR1 related small G protein [Enterocytozoon bieneusi H348]|nr:GTPase SAR1 related small G protein [Enterocytozoon bieneusi H348]|eukprot:XP_002650369.1 GTPase SAR1 related small G protein [Enterocytozoon bieneusi H348]
MNKKKVNRLKTFKLINIGQTNVGKSSILLKYTKNEFNSNINNTVGIDNINKEIIIENEPIILQLWDTAGQERFNSIVKSYYRGADGFLFVFDVTDMRSFEYIKDKIQLIYNENKNINLGVVIGNKIDLLKNKNDLNIIQQQGELLAHQYNYQFYLTSAKTGANIESVFKSLATTIYNVKKTTIEQQDIVKKVELNKKIIRKRCC